MDSLDTVALAALDPLVTAEGWPMASAPYSADDPQGRFACLFGRDSIITALEVLPIRPRIAEAVLRVLGEKRGRRTDPATAEEPGKILHEERPQAGPWFLERGWPVAADGSLRYYGTVEATALYLILAARTGYSGAATDAALQWLLDALHGSELLTYDGHKGNGLYHQGWRDGTWTDPNNGIRWPDGDEIEGPIAVASAQAFAFEALRSSGYHSRADRLARAVDDAFYRHGQPWPAIAVDSHGRAVPTMASEIGILLWAGMLGPHRVPGAVAALEHLSTDWGVRTISPDHPTFAPHLYHFGAIWPFENWFVWAGLRRARAMDLAERVRSGVLRAVLQIGRMPECYVVPLGGSAPIIHNKAARTQAWTAGAVWALENDWDGFGVIDPKREREDQY
jgi:glycogen debranching enzyme